VGYWHGSPVAALPLYCYNDAWKKTVAGQLNDLFMVNLNVNFPELFGLVVWLNR
jgi:hypothetical protein